MHEQPNLSRSSKAKKVKKVQKFRKVKEVKKVRKVKKLRKVKKFRKAKKVEKAKKVKKANCKTWLGLLVPIPNAGEKETETNENNYLLPFTKYLHSKVKIFKLAWKCLL